MSLPPFRQITISSSDAITLFLRDYGNVAAPLTVICLPGLTRNSADFGTLAQHLSGHGHRVICPDFRGRGQSAYDPNFMNYVPPVYARDVVEILETLGIGRALFVGTSLGGIVTQIIALARPSMVAGAVLNDIGTELAPEGLARIMSYTGEQPDPADWDEARVQVKALNQAFFPKLDDAAWDAFAHRLFTEKTTGGLRPAYDPKIADALHNAAPASDMWALFSALEKIPTLLIRGALSDLLSIETVARMVAAKTDLEVLTIPDEGHAPLLDEPISLRAVDQLVAHILKN